MIATLVSALALAAAATPADDGKLIVAAFTQVQQGQPAAAITTLAPVIARYDRAAAADDRTTYCAINPAQTIAYMARAAAAKRGAVAVDRSYCEALFLTGFALIDLGRVDEAQAAYRHLIVRAPMDAHYLAEYGQSFRMQKKWPEMLAACRDAESFAGMANNPATERGNAWRCQGYALIEQGKWNEAEALYRKCLAADPNDAKARNELQFVIEQRAKPKS